MTSYEQSRLALESLCEWYKDKKGTRNEATTRLQLIDRIFFECLGWSKGSVVLEEAHSTEYADYAFSCPNRMLIVEAKKEGDYFELPVGKENLEYSLPSLCKDFPKLKAALTQVAHYAQSRGTPFAVVSNGHQLVAFVAARSDGTPPLEAHGMVFPTLEYMVSHFHDLWQHLSPDGVAQGKLHARLVSRLVQELPRKLSSTIVPYPGVKGRNVFQTDFQILSELVLEDIASSPDLEVAFLKDCYCQSGALSQHALTSKKILKTRYEAIFDSDRPGPTIVSAPEKHAGSTLLAESLSRRPILLIGDVGVGKTTFIRRLLKVDAEEEFRNSIALYIDLGSQATLDTGVGQWIIKEIKRQCKAEYSIDIDERNFVHGVYHSDINDFQKGIYGDLKESHPTLYREKEVEFLAGLISQGQEHLRRSLEHLSLGRKKQIVIFLDNADQRRDIEEQVFLVSQELASRWPATVFVTLRPETFHRSRVDGVLSGYHPKAFTISPPRIERVIEQRLRFAQKLTSGQIPIPTLHTDIKLSKLGHILASFEASLSRNPALVECIDNMSAGNVRMALDYVKAFFGSGHVDTEKISTICEAGGEYVVPVHEFLRASIYGDCKHFSPSVSPAVNLFDVSSADPKEHFLLLMILQLLERGSQTSTEAGFVSSGHVVEKMQEQGFVPTQVIHAVIRAWKGGLCETSGRVEPTSEGDLPHSLRVTTKGIYHAVRLARFFTYLDAVCVDIPVFDSEVRKSIRDVNGIVERIERAAAVRGYLDRVWNGLGKKCEFFDWNDVSNDLGQDIEVVRRRTVS